ncbi:hypothetical protein [Chitinibacter tainanensis]|uniref:hypothetical protein n=1 Tax=Chitinibacter tainanensis TaxID=230667 RepID=UPI002356769A|nr:hypothetical protein [Chitinibacter tainanensis]
MATNWKVGATPLNGYFLGMNLALLSKSFIPHEPLFPFYPLGLIWLLYLGVIVFVAWQVIGKPSIKTLFSVLTALLGLQICFLLIEAGVQYTRGTQYYWRSFSDLVMFILLWLWLNRHRQQSIACADSSGQIQNKDI